MAGHGTIAKERAQIRVHVFVQRPHGAIVLLLPVGQRTPVLYAHRAALVVFAPDAVDAHMRRFGGARRIDVLGRGHGGHLWIVLPVALGHGPRPVHRVVAQPEQPGFVRVGGALAGQDEPAQALVDASESGESLL